ncbi:MAG: 4Fe-4S dicluster domain-containing protein [Desulfobacterales bacterium]|nr:4Fe-4S dicluster domain-containing protein [Desulfobacterales bacterium]MBF0398649.1 4Fe-4S dicluster domain-containing protein [Desulfobacterales bacterium]
MIMNLNFSRRQFLKVSGLAIAGISALSSLGVTYGMAEVIIITEQAEGLVIGDPTKCVGCRRCELACTEFNDGKASSTISRIKINRNLQLGYLGLYTGKCDEGKWGIGLIIQDICKQCPHPVPCADACPNDAIVIKPPINARVVDSDKCTGCKMCQRSCPWDMISFDSDTNKATKCFLCDGKPKCVEACPAEALKYVRWRDLSRSVPTRISPTSVISQEKIQACMGCHK